jgi:transcription antitermination protein NusB
MGTRRKSRELVLQMLFQADMGKQDAEQVRRTFWAEHGTASAEVRGFADDLFRVATDRVGEIDGLIEKHAEHSQSAAGGGGRVFGVSGYAPGGGD